MFLGPHDVLYFFQVREDSIRSMVVATLFVLQVYILGSLFLMVFYRRLKRIYLRRQNSIRETRYRDMILSYLVSDEAQTFDRVVEIQKALRNVMERGFFRRLLLIQMDTVSGSGKYKFLVLYKILGFFDEDERKLMDRRWWIRMEALLRLSLLEDPEAKHIFFRHLNDPSDLIASAAIRALSRFPTKEYIVPIFEALNAKVFHRRDMLMEVLLNLGRVEPELVLDYLKKAETPFLKTLCIRVLGIARYQQALEVLLEMTNSSHLEVQIEAVNALGQIKDPLATERLKALVKRPEPSLRASALSSITLIEPKNRIQFAKFIQADPSVEVQQALFQIKERRAG